MSSLGEQTEELKRELDLFLEGDENRVAIEELEIILEELITLETNSSVPLQCFTSLSEFPDQFETAYGSEYTDLKSSAVEALEELDLKWSEIGYKIRQEGVVAKAVDATNRFVDCLVSHNQSVWNDRISKLELVFGVTEAELNSVSSVPEYRRPIEQYRKLREAFDEAAKALPKDKEGIEYLLDLADRLRKTRDGIRFDLPEKVLAFFKEIDLQGSFPLRKLETEVVDWLEANGGLNELVITRRGFSRL